jgi:hypothetical protein
LQCKKCSTRALAHNCRAKRGMGTARVRLEIKGVDNIKFKVLGVGDLLHSPKADEADAAGLGEARDGRRDRHVASHVRRAHLHEGVPLGQQSLARPDAEAALRDGPHAAHAAVVAAAEPPPSPPSPSATDAGLQCESGGRRAPRHRHGKIRGRQQPRDYKPQIGRTFQRAATSARRIEKLFFFFFFTKLRRDSTALNLTFPHRVHCFRLAATKFSHVHST